MMENNLDLDGINLLAKERPDILALICSETFLPPTQLVFALIALEQIEDKSKIYPYIPYLLDHYSEMVVKTAARILEGKEEESEQVDNWKDWIDYFPEDLT